MSQYSIKHRPAPRGFTLIELLVAIGILAALMAAVVPAIGAIGRGTASANTLNEVSASLGAARAIAMKEGRDTAVIFRGSSNNNTGQVEVILAIRNITDTSTNNYGFAPYEKRDGVKLPPHARIAGLTSLAVNPDWRRPDSVNPTPLASKSATWIGVCFGPNGRIKSLDTIASSINLGANQYAYYDEDSDNALDAASGKFEQPILFVPVLAAYDARLIPEGQSDDTVANLKNFINSQLTDLDANASRVVRPVFFDSYTGQILR